MFQYWLLRSQPADPKQEFDEEMEDEVMVGANQFLYNYRDKSSRHVHAYVFSYSVLWRLHLRFDKQNSELWPFKGTTMLGWLRRKTQTVRSGECRLGLEAQTHPTGTASEGI